MIKAIRARLAVSFEGLSAESAALALAVGVVLGTFPIYGCPTILCALASLLFGVNLPAVQLVNQLVTPLWWALLVPFVRLGARIVPVEHWLLAPALQAVAGWACVSGPLGVLVYFALLGMLRRFESGRLISAPAR